MDRLSIIIPVLNEAKCISNCINNLQYLRKLGHEVIVIDGGSDDGTCKLIDNKIDKVLLSSPGRAIQMNLGAQSAEGDVYLFLHADTILPADVDGLLRKSIQTDLAWGRFDIKLSGRHLLFRIIEYFTNMRSRLTGIATGDQAIFVTRQLFNSTKGFPVIPLMEDVSFSSSLKRVVRPVCLRNKVLTSSRRWEEYGILRTVVKMWSLRFRYALGVSPNKLASEYD